LPRNGGGRYADGALGRLGRVIVSPPMGIKRGGDWQPAKAKVTAKRESSKFAMGGTATQRRYEYVLDISPPGGGEPFTTTMITPMMTRKWRELRVGEVVTVLCELGTRNVKWDKNERSTNRQAVWDAEKKKQKRSADEAFEKAQRDEHRPPAD
jgi:hypothetical protein